MHQGGYRNACDGMPALLLGNGPSLNHVDFDRVDVPVVIGMNRSWKAHQATYHCLMYREDHIAALTSGECRPRVLFSLMQPHQAAALRQRLPELHQVRFPQIRTKHPLGTMAFDGLEKGTPCRNTGQMAIEVALWLGCDPVYLIGYDLGYNDGHFFDDVSPNDDWRDRQRALFSLLAKNVSKKYPERSIINLNADSDIAAFQFSKLEAIYGRPKGRYSDVGHVDERKPDFHDVYRAGESE